MYCWGSNAHGECDVPRALQPVVKVDTGLGFTCTLTLDNELACWGASAINIPFIDGLAGLFDYGQLKLQILNFAIGETHICAVRSDFLLKCWGKNLYGLIEVPLLVQNNVDKV